MRSVSSGERLRCLRACSTKAAVISFAGSNSLTVKPSSHASWPQFRQWIGARLTSHSLISTRSDPHWQKSRTATVGESNVRGEEKANVGAHFAQLAFAYALSFRTRV